MKCRKCHHENPDSQKFCGECGSDLRKAKDISSEKFSSLHSHTPKFLADKILTNKSFIEGERKHVTVFFADVVGFASISEKLDPEEVRQIMDGCYQIIIHQIHKYEGTVDKFTGDGAMALFGAPIAHEDHAQRACHASLAIQKAMVVYSKKVKKEHNVNFEMRVGLNSGQVVVGTVGDDLRMDYTAIGDTVNLASRMESTARPGTVLVSNNTYKRASKHFQFTSLGKVKVKGKEIPQDVYELVDTIEWPKSGLDRQIFSEIVGREKELNLLEIQVLKAVNGEGSVVNIIGEAGIGKSRLVAELKNREIMKRVTLLEGRAILMGRNLSFHPIIDLLKQWARIKEEDSEATVLSKLEIAVRRVYPEGIHEVLPFVATLMGINLSGRYAERVKGIEGEALEKLILKNVRDLFIKSTELSPIMIVTEDLHWADTSSIELIESLFCLAETQRIVFVNVLRPGHKKTGDRIVETIKERLSVYYVEIVLQPLDEKMSVTLINNMLSIKGLHHTVKERIAKLSGGNPFFIEEVIRSFIDEEALIAKGGGFEVTDKIYTVVIPNTINDVLMARIDRLDEKTRDLVKVASVIGRSFFYRILREIADTIDAIDSRLSHLKDVQIIRERTRMEELEYLFKHALAQEAAYETILFQKRKKLHLKVANSIEHIFSKQLHLFYGMLAYHYSRGEDLDKSEEYMLKAGEEALKASASSEALNYYQQALKLFTERYGSAGDPEILAVLEKNIGQAFYNKGQSANAVKYFDIVLDRWKAGSTKNKIIKRFNLITDLLSLIANMYLPFKRGNKIPKKRDNEILDLMFKRGISLVHFDQRRMFIEGLRILKLIISFDIGKVENGYAIWTTHSGMFSFTAISFKLSKKILDYSKASMDINNIRELMVYTSMEVVHNYCSGTWSEIKEYDDILIEKNLQIGELWQVTNYTCWYTLTIIEQGRFKEADILIRKLSEIWEDYKYELARAYQYLLKGTILIKSRKLYETQVEMDAGILFLTQIGMDGPQLNFLGSKIITQILLKDIEGAIESLPQAKEIVLQQELIPPIYITSYIMSQFLIDLYLLEDSILSKNKKKFELRKNAYQSGKLALRHSDKFAPAREETLRLMGLFYWLIGKQKKASNYWGKSIKEGERLDARPGLARTYMEIGKHFLEEKSKYKELNGISAKEYLEKARTMFKEMDLQWDLDELDKFASDS